MTRLRRRSGPRARRDVRGLSTQDLIVESISGVGSRPGRLLITLSGTVLGIAALVVTVGFAQTAAHQIARQFDAAAATQVVVAPAKARTASGNSVATTRLPWDSPERVRRLVGVEDAGLVGPVDLGDLTITAVPVNDPATASATPPALAAASGGLLEAVGARVVTGRTFDSGHDARGDRVAVLGSRAAERLGVTRVDSQPSIFIGGIAYAVIGIVDDMQRRSDLKDAVVIPDGAARADFGYSMPEELQVRIAVGVGPQIARQAPIALDPNTPESFEVVAPGGASDLSTGVQTDVNLVFLLLGGIALLAGGIGIANVTLLSVMERTGEIGLRRALGARRRDVAAQFMLESVVLGALGGLIGASVGVFVVVGISALQQWTPVIDLWVVVGAAALGPVVGLAAGALPARRAARIEPVDALRGS